MTSRPANSAVTVDVSALRLRRHADFQAVYRLARKQYGKQISFFFARRVPLGAAVAMPGGGTVPPDGAAVSAAVHSGCQPFSVAPPSGPRVGLTVGKVLGKAHDRNRIKRRLREAVRRQAGILATLPVDVVLHPKRSYLDLPWTELESEVAQAFQTVRRLADKPQIPSPQRERKSGAGKPGRSAKGVPAQSPRQGRG